MNDMGKLQGMLIGRFRMVACFRLEEESKSPSRRRFRGDASKGIRESLPRRKSGVTASIPVSKRTQSGVAQDVRRSEQPMGDRRARASFSFEVVRYNGGRLRFRHKRGCCGSFRFNYSKYFEQFEYFKYDRRRRYRGRRSCRHFHGAVASEKCSFYGNRACGEGPSHRTAQLPQGESRPLRGLRAVSHYDGLFGRGRVF